MSVKGGFAVPALGNAQGRGTITVTAGQGTICRVKALKRQMSGRANLDLLRKRILLST